MPTFKQLNFGWNAHSNVPMPEIGWDGADLILQFFLNSLQFERFQQSDQGILRFHECMQYRLGPTNDEGWYLGQCRYSGSAPSWGEFYELNGDDPLLDRPSDWIKTNSSPSSNRHFLFYFRDGTFECIAADWSYDSATQNALAAHKEIER